MTEDDELRMLRLYMKQSNPIQAETHETHLFKKEYDIRVKSEGQILHTLLPVYTISS